MKRLHTRLYFHFLAVLLVVGMGTSAVFSLGQRGALLREVTERLSRHLAGELGPRFSDPSSRREAVARMHQDFEMELTVRGLDGQVLTAAGTSLPPLSPAELALLSRGERVVRSKPQSAVVPIQDVNTGAVLGYLDMAVPHRFRSRSLANLTSVTRPLLAVALVLLLVALATAPLARRISRPVERLTEATRRFGAGDLSYRIPLSRPRWRRGRIGGRRQGGPGDPVCRRGHRSFADGHWSFTGADGHDETHGRIDELHALELAWNEMAERIERLLRGQKELLANISHELRSPLTRVRVALELLPRDGESEARLREVEADLGELERLIGDVLMTSRLEVTGLPTRPGPVSLEGLLQQVAERAMHDPLTSGKTVRIAPLAAPITLRADAALLKRALFNLVENAAKYGAPPIEIAATRSPVEAGEAAEPLVEIAVTDEGEGVSAAERERVFEPFYRADKARTPHKAGGFGLGLTLSRRVAEAHGGTIEVGPAHIDAAGNERGCRVTLHLPLDPPERATDLPAAAAAPAAGVRFGG